MSTWPTVFVRELVQADEAAIKTGPFGTQLKAAEYVEHGVPVINVRNIGFGTIRDEKLEFIDDTTANRLNSHRLRSNDIVFGRKGAVERHVLIGPNQNGWIQGSDCLRLRLNPGRIIPRFASYCLLLDHHKSWIMGQASHGATMPTLNQDIIERIELPQPPPSTQRRIVSILSAYDDLIENNTRRIAILEEMARRLFEEIQSESAPSSETMTLGEIADRVGGLVKTGPFGSQLHESDYTQEGIPVVMPKDIIGGRVSTMSIARIDEDTTKRLNHHQLLEGDIVYGRRGDIGRRALIRRRQVGYLCGTGCLRISVHGDVIAPRYLFAYLGLPEVIAEIAGKAVGATMPNLNTSILRGVQIQVPPMKAQKRYVEAAADLDDLAETLLEANQRLRAARDLLLPKLISGEIDVSRAPLPVEIAAE
ncbi:type I restriction enzyme, S subunit [Azospirillum sp. RU38E]|nr:type I restriction enzyme, S subunit [Azospirillum sp. RU38E]SNT25484.1 type I restriction enzyme, S subunit [Azospirillum sp. RU37A]